MDRKRIIKNAIKCNHCGEIIVSTSRHHLVRCKCGYCDVDGGNDYLRRGFTNSPEDFTEMSEVEEVDPLVDIADMSEFNED